MALLSLLLPINRSYEVGDRLQPQTSAPEHKKRHRLTKVRVRMQQRTLRRRLLRAIERSRLAAQRIATNLD
jgi:hypothetical protein